MSQHECSAIDSGARIGNLVKIGKSVTISKPVSIGQGASLLDNALITRDVPPYAIMRGHDQVVDYFGSEDCQLENVSLVDFDIITDDRGSLMFGEFERKIPFNAKRFFTIFGVRENTSRGDHSHKECHQFVLCLHGTVSVVCDDGKARKKVFLENSKKGIHINPGVWTSLYSFSEDAVVLVFTSHYYDTQDYIHSYQEFKQSI
mgnify:CR=1 FL=1